MQVDALKLKLQVLCGDSFAIGPGKADVLEAIDRYGSISAAGRALGMSYRRIWLLVDEMNRCFVDRIVETQAGGGGSRGAHLTASGYEVLAAFRELEAQASALIGTPAYRLLAGRIRVTPLRTKRT